MSEKHTFYKCKIDEDDDYDNDENGDSRGSFRRIGHGASDRHVKQRDHSRLPSAWFGRSQVEVGLWKRWKSSSGMYESYVGVNRTACATNGRIIHNFVASYPVLFA